MRTYRFGRKIKLPATIAIKHQLRMLMAQDEAKKAEADARAERDWRTLEANPVSVTIPTRGP
jgi:cell division protein FtsL